MRIVGVCPLMSYQGDNAIHGCLGASCILWRQSPGTDGQCALAAMTEAQTAQAKALAAIAAEIQKRA